MLNFQPPVGVRSSRGRGGGVGCSATGKVEPALRTPSVGFHLLRGYLHSVHSVHTMDKNPMRQDGPPPPVLPHRFGEGVQHATYDSYSKIPPTTFKWAVSYKTKKSGMLLKRRHRPGGGARGLPLWGKTCPTHWQVCVCHEAYHVCSLVRTQHHTQHTPPHAACGRSSWPWSCCAPRGAHCHTGCLRLPATRSRCLRPLNALKPSPSSAERQMPECPTDKARNCNAGAEVREEGSIHLQLYAGTHTRTNARTRTHTHTHTRARAHTGVGSTVFVSPWVRQCVYVCVHVQVRVCVAAVCALRATWDSFRIVYIAPRWQFPPQPHVATCFQGEEGEVRTRDSLPPASNPHGGACTLSASGCRSGERGGPCVVR